MKRLHIVLEDEEYEKLKSLKDMLGLNWKELILKLADEYMKTPESKCVDELKLVYVSTVKLLIQIGKLIEASTKDNEYRLAALFPLLVSGERIEGEEFKELISFLINTSIMNIAEKYRGTNEAMFTLFELLRIALIREVQGDTVRFIRFMEMFCENLKKLGK